MRYMGGSIWTEARNAQQGVSMLSRRGCWNKGVHVLTTLSLNTPCLMQSLMRGAGWSICPAGNSPHRASIRELHTSSSTHHKASDLCQSMSFTFGTSSGSSSVRLV